MSNWKTLVYHEIEFPRLEVSDTGEIRNKKTQKILKQQISAKGYCSITTSNGNSKAFNIKIHRAVAENFIPNPQKLDQVNHKNGNKQNNNVDNLEWITNRDNTIHAIKTGIYNPHTNSKSKKIMCVDDNTVYESIGEAAVAYSIFSTSSENVRKNISRALVSKGKAYGKEWKYIE